MQPVVRPAGKAITSLQFQSVLKDVFGIEKPWLLRRVGLAISGGVDSMALLFMWNRFIKHHGIVAPSSCSVFVVDHEVRPNSATETRQIAAYIKQITDIDARILTLDWAGRDPRSLPNFEGYARRIRYQALGRACRQEGISKLMVGHHADDSVETVLSRIAINHHGEHLRGIDPVAQIPECEGEHGICESGSPVPLARSGYSQPWCYESGGVSLLRPLLDFPKKDLIATCDVNKIPWFEDATNHDPTFTGRNAIRSMFNSEQLPAALSPDRLRTMMSTIRSNQAKAKELRDAYLSKCVVLSLDLRCGELAIFLPRFKDVFPTMSASASLATKYDICCGIVAYLRALVAPTGKASKLRLGSIVTTMFPGEFPELEALSREVPAFTTGSTLMEPMNIDREIKQLGKRRLNTQAKTIQKLTTAKNRRFSLWRFARQPFAWDENLPAILITPGTNQDDNHQSSLDEKYPGLVINHQNEFASWDSRFWIRASLHDTDHGVVITPPTLKALTELSSTFDVAGEEHAKDRLWAHVLLGEARRNKRKLQSIPAIVAPPGLPSVAAGSILALPTYNLVHPKYRKRIKWEFRYKRIDLGSLSPLQPGPINSLLQGNFPSQPQLLAEL